MRKIIADFFSDVCTMGCTWYRVPVCEGLPAENGVWVEGYKVTLVYRFTQCSENKGRRTIVSTKESAGQDAEFDGIVLNSVSTKRKRVPLITRAVVGQLLLEIPLLSVVNGKCVLSTNTTLVAGAGR